MVNFRIVEGKSEVDFERFKILFFDPSKKVKDVCDELDISKKKYDRLRKELIDEIGYVKKPVDHDLLHQRNPMRFITTHQDGRYSVNKQINNHKYYFGSYRDLETAKNVRNYLEAHNWDEDVFYEIRKRIKEKNKKDAYSEDEYAKVKKDYMDGYKVHEIIKRNRITPYKYSCISKRVREEENLFTKPRRRIRC